MQHIPPSVPPIWKESRVFLTFYWGAASTLSYSLTERSTEDETPIARAVSGSFECVSYARYLRSLLI